jgi:hypothetical protein
VKLIEAPVELRCVSSLPELAIEKAEKGSRGSLQLEIWNKRETETNLFEKIKEGQSVESKEKLSLLGEMNESQQEIVGLKLKHQSEGIMGALEMERE